MGPCRLLWVAYQESSKNREGKPGCSPLLSPVWPVIRTGWGLPRPLSGVSPENTGCCVIVTSHIGQVGRDPRGDFPHPMKLKGWIFKPKTLETSTQIKANMKSSKREIWKFTYRTKWCVYQLKLKHPEWHWKYIWMYMVKSIAVGQSKKKIRWEKQLVFPTLPSQRQVCILERCLSQITCLKQNTRVTETFILAHILF